MLMDARFAYGKAMAVSSIRDPMMATSGTEVILEADIMKPVTEPLELIS